MGVGNSVKTLPSECFCLLALGVPVPSACLCHPQLCRLLQIYWSTVSLAPAMGNFTLAASQEQALRDAEFLTKHSERQFLPWIVAMLRIGTGRENWASKHLVPDQTQPYKYIGKAGTLAKLAVIWHMWSHHCRCCMGETRRLHFWRRVSLKARVDLAGALGHWGHAF